jgi:hypothetical protein
MNRKAYARIGGGCLASLLGPAILIVYQQATFPMGIYRGDLLNAFAVETTFVLTNGGAYFCHEETKMVPAGKLIEKEGQWWINSGTDPAYRVHRTLLGMEMINATNEADHYRFFRRPWPVSE